MEAINVLTGLLLTYRPGTFVTWSAEDVEATPNLAGDRTLALIGEADGGAPLAAYVLPSPARARAVLRGGPLLDAALLAFESAGQGGLTIVAVNVQGGTQATLDITGESGVFGTLTSAAYRERANQMRAQVYGTAALGYTVAIDDADTGFQLSGSNIGLALHLTYVGKGDTATAEVKVVDGVKRLVVTVTGEGAGDSVSLALAQGVTIGDLVRTLQASGPYVATAARDARLLAAGLDDTTAPVDIKGKQGLFTAIKADFAQFFATTGGGEVTFTSGADALPAANFTGLFSGGTTVKTKTGDWAKAMGLLEKVPAALIVPLTADQVVVAGLRAELTQRNSAQQAQFSMMIAGYDDARLPATNSLTDTNAYAAQAGADLGVVNDYQFQLVMNTGDTTLPATGTRGRVPMFIAAAILAGEILGRGIEESATYAYVALSNPFPVFDLQQSGALVRLGATVFEQPTAGGPVRVVRDRTTYNATNNPIYESGMSVRVMNSVARGFKALQDRYIPGAASAKRLADFQSAANDYFEEKVERGYLTGDGVDANGQSVPPYSFTVERTRAGGRQVISRSTVVPRSEFVVGEHRMVARSVEFQVASSQ